MNAGTMLVGPVHDGRSHQLIAMGDTVDHASLLEVTGTPGRICAPPDIAEYLPSDWQAVPRPTITTRKGREVETVELTRVEA